MGRVRLLRQPFRFFWGLRLHLQCTLHGLPVGFALTGAKADERHTPLGILEADPGTTRRPTPAGVWVRVVQHVLALTAAIWHNDHTNQPIKRSLLAYDH